MGLLDPEDPLYRDWEARRDAFASDARPDRSRLRRTAWLTAGWAAFALGALGAILPVLPTTPFMIVAAACFARSSARFYAWLMRSRLFGPVIWSWRTSRTIPARAKALAITLIVITGTLSVAVVPLLWVRLAVAAILIAVSIRLLMVPTRRPPDARLD